MMMQTMRSLDSKFAEENLDKVNNLPNYANSYIVHNEIASTGTGLDLASCIKSNFVPFSS